MACWRAKDSNALLQIWTRMLDPPPHHDDNEPEQPASAGEYRITSRRRRGHRRRKRRRAAIVLELAKSGVACCLVGRTLSKLEKVARLTARTGVKSILMVADLGDLGAVAALAQRIRSSRRRIDCLVHSAAAITVSRVEDSTVEEFSRLMTVNVLAPFALTKQLLPEI